MSNYIKIEFDQSKPFVSMEYDDMDSFQNLIFFLISPSGTELFLKTIEKDFVEKNKEEELEIIKALMFIVNQDKDDLILDSLSSNYPLIKPSSFK